MVKADNTQVGFISLHIICYLGHLMGKKESLISVGNVIDLSKLHEISFVNRKGMSMGVRCRARVPGELYRPPQ